MGPPEILTVLLLILLVCLVASLVTIIRVRRTRYIFNGGWLIIITGVIFTSEKVYELTHLTDAEITRGPLDQLTNNAKLHLAFHNHGTIVLTGLAPFEELREIRTRLNNLSRMLRSNPLLKGIVT
jgi:Uncharacterized conserved protein